MKNGLLLTLSAFVIIMFAITMISADDYNTLIAGKIYDSPNFETAGAVSGATVHVTCNSTEHTALSLSDGTYSVTFIPSEGCLDTTASAYAEKDGITSNTQTATIQDYTTSFDLYLGVINIALIPEFGVVVGILTLASAVGIFFFVRRR
ncbi:MAG: hypothetical protein ABIH65_00110 [Nanoarchaeota archaeon]